MTETIIICTLFGVFIFASFITGLYYGSKVKRDEKIELPKPIKAIKKNREEKEAKIMREKEELIEEINIANIESYDGTGIGQIDFPKD